MRRVISVRVFEALPKNTRILLFGMAVFVVTLWLFPLVETTYRVWSNLDRRWVPFETTYKREFVTNLQFGEVPYYAYYRDPLLRTAMSRTGEISQPINRMIGIKWSTQIVQTLLIVGLSFGLLWVMKAK